MIIGLTGYAQSGKDTVAKTLIDNYGFERVAFADPIRTMLYNMNPIIGFVANEPVYLRTRVDRDGWDESKKSPEVRRLLQELGLSAREALDDAVWVVAALRQLGDLDQNYVITDVRFENEALHLKAVGAQLWRVTRPGVEAVNNHISEHELNNYPVDQIFVNNGTLQDLELLVKTRMASYAKSA